MKPNYFIITLLVLFSNYCFSQSDEDFFHAATANDGTEYFVYIEKVTYGGSKEIWVKNVTPIKSVKNKKGKIVKTGGEKTLSFMKINCEGREYDIIETIIYNSKGQVIAHEDLYDMGNKVIPGSIISGIYDSVCSE